MNLRFTAQEEAFRAELRALIGDALPDWWHGMFVDDERVIPFTKQFCETLASKQWLTVAWPKEFGGKGGTIWEEIIVREEMWAHEEPRGPQYLNINFIGPMIMRFGTDEQKSLHLTAMSNGTALWTQGFSEPNAGSDLAGVQTFAEDNGSHFVVNGQKIWNSYADAPADWCLLVVRTQRGAERHAGLSVLLVDMQTPGITVRPIRSMAGPRDITEIFLDNVVVPKTCLLGPHDDGWNVITTGLTYERLGIARYARTARVIELLSDYMTTARVQQLPKERRQAIKLRIAALHVRQQAAQWLTYRALSLQEKGEAPAVAAAVARIHNTLVEQEAGHVGLEVLGCLGRLRQGDVMAPLDGAIERQWLHNIPASIVAGTLEIQKNIIAKSGLGL